MRLSNVPGPCMPPDMSTPKGASGEIDVEVCFALRDHQEIISLRVPSGATVEQAIKLSGILAKFPEIDLARNQVGIFGRLARLTTPLHERDRVEIYRPLLIDPRENRRRRAGSFRSPGTGDRG
jgi:uncharacterized protein